jgi:hypothetical protein
LKTSADIYDSDFEKCGMTFEQWATKLRQGCLQRRKSAHRTVASDSSSWPTATGTVINDGETLESWYRRKAKNLALRNNGNGMGTPLTIAAQQWPTPVATVDSGPNNRYQKDDSKAGRMLSKESELWATPNCHDGSRPAPDLHSTQGRNLSRESAIWPTPHQNCVTGAGTQGRDGGENLQTKVAQWETPAARDWRSDSSQKTSDEIYGKKGRPLPRRVLEHYQCGHQGPQIPQAGLGCSSDGQNSPRQWKTPHGIGNVGATGNIGGGSEFQKQVRTVTGRKRLNVLFVEWLMNFPRGWTSLERSATPWCQPKPSSHSESSSIFLPQGVKNSVA